MKKALITGATGFVGGHLKAELAGYGYEVVCLGREGFNLLDYESVHAVIREHKPDVIFHLAAVAFVPTSWKDPEMVFRVNTIGTLNLFNAVRSVGIDPVIQIAGSSEEYGLVLKDEIPINENNPLRPLSPYAVSKVAMDMLGWQYFRSYGMKIIRTRAFNHEGYGRPASYMPSGFAKQIVEIEKRLKEPVIEHGDLTAIRDITDVRDMARAYRLAVERCVPGEIYNIGTGKGYSVSEIIETFRKLSNVKFELKLDQNRIRPSDVPVLICNNERFVKLTEWKPEFSLQDTLNEELKYWRNVLR